MDLTSKINGLMDSQQMNASDLYRAIKSLFGEKGISMSLVYRATSGKPRYSDEVICQIATALGVTEKELRKGTKYEEPEGIYRYNKKALMRIYHTGLQFLPSELEIEPGPGGKTHIEAQNKNKGKCDKYIKVLKGVISIVFTSTLNNDEPLSEAIEIKRVRKGDSEGFDATRPHYFLNRGKGPATAICVEYPKSY